MAQAPEQIHGDEIHFGFVDFNQNEARQLRLHQLGANPGTPVNGQVWYRSDTHRPFVRANGVDQQLAFMSDVTAGGISSSIIDAKGDSLWGTADNTIARQAVGADGTVIVAASGQTTGVNWRRLTEADFDFSATQRLGGRGTAGAGAGEEISVGGGIEFNALSIQTSAFTGDVTKAAGGTVLTIPNDTVTYAKFQNVVNNNRFLGRVSGANGDVEELTAAQAKTILAYTAAEITFAPGSGIAAVNVQTAVEELKADVDAAITANTESKTWKEPVAVIGTANRALTGLAAIDGYTPAAGDRIALVGQTAPAENGIWIAAAGAWARAADANTTAELLNATVLSLNGNTVKGDAYTQTATVTTVGTTAQTWVKTSEGNSVYTSDGTTIILTGNSFSVGTVPLTSTSGTLGADRGGTGQAGGYTVGDLLQATGAAALGKLAAVATGNVLLSGGVGAVSSWGKVGLTTHVTGTLPIGNGGTGATTADAAALALGTGRARAGALTGGANTFAIVHNLNTRDIAQVTLVNTVAPYDSIKRFYWEATDANTVTVYAAAGATLPTGYRWVLLAV